MGGGGKETKKWRNSSGADRPQTLCVTRRAASGIRSIKKNSFVPPYKATLMAARNKQTQKHTSAGKQHLRRGLVWLLARPNLRPARRRTPREPRCVSTALLHPLSLSARVFYLEMDRKRSSIDLLPAYPAEAAVAVEAQHLVAAAQLLDRRFAAGARLCRPADQCHGAVGFCFFFNGWCAINNKQARQVEHKGRKALPFRQA